MKAKLSKNLSDNKLGLGVCIVAILMFLFMLPSFNTIYIF